MSLNAMAGLLGHFTRVLHIDVLYVNIQPLQSLLVIAVRNTIYKTTLAVRRKLVLLRQCYLLKLQIDIPSKL